MTIPCNCLPEGETLADLIRRNCAIGFDLRFCRSIATSPEGDVPVDVETLKKGGVASPEP